MTRTARSELLPLPALSFYILLALGEGAAHGWGIVKRIRDLTEGHSDPSTGSLYLAMVRMEQQGLLEECAAPAREPDDERRRYYRLTSLGRRVARDEALRMVRLVEQARLRRFLPMPAEDK